MDKLQTLINSECYTLSPKHVSHSERIISCTYVYLCTCSVRSLVFCDETSELCHRKYLPKVCRLLEWQRWYCNGHAGDSVCYRSQKTCMCNGSWNIKRSIISRIWRVLTIVYNIRVNGCVHFFTAYFLVTFLRLTSGVRCLYSCCIWHGLSRDWG
jgi:hypothetical protein